MGYIIAFAIGFIAALSWSYRGGTEDDAPVMCAKTNARAIWRGSCGLVRAVVAQIWHIVRRNALF